MKASNLRNLIIPSIEHFTEMGLRRSTVYVARTYSQLLRKYKLESNPLATPATDHLRKVKSYAERAIFIVPQKAPKYVPKPFLQYEQPPIAITLGSHDLLQKFATAFFQPTKWTIPQDGSIKPYLDNLTSISSCKMDESAVKEALRCTIQQGLLFTAPISETRIENLYNWQYLSVSDSVYHSLRSEYGNIPYFLSVDAFYELALYALRLFFTLWLYGNEKDIREKITPDSKAIAEKAIEDAYLLLATTSNTASESLAESFLGAQKASETKTWRLRQYAWRNLCNHLSAWIQIEVNPKFLRITSENTSRSAINTVPMGTEKKDWTAHFHYQCSNLFSCIALEALGLLSKNATYKVCQHQGCNTIFTTATSRSDKMFCSSQCRTKFHNAGNQATRATRKAKKELIEPD